MYVVCFVFRSKSHYCTVFVVNRPLFARKLHNRVVLRDCNDSCQRCHNLEKLCALRMRNATCAPFLPQSIATIQTGNFTFFTKSNNRVYTNFYNAFILFKIKLS